MTTPPSEPSEPFEPAVPPRQFRTVPAPPPPAPARRRQPRWVLPLVAVLTLVVVVAAFRFLPEGVADADEGDCVELTEAGTARVGACEDAATLYRVSEVAPNGLPCTTRSRLPDLDPTIEPTSEPAPPPPARLTTVTVDQTTLCLQLDLSEGECLRTLAGSDYASVPCTDDAAELRAARRLDGEADPALCLDVAGLLSVVYYTTDSITYCLAEPAAA